MVRKGKKFERLPNLFNVASSRSFCKSAFQRDSAGTPERKAPFLLYPPMCTYFVGGLSSWNKRKKETKIVYISSMYKTFDCFRLGLAYPPTHPYPSTHPRFTLPLDHAVRCGLLPLVSARSTILRESFPSQFPPPPSSHPPFFFSICGCNKLRFPPVLNYANSTFRLSLTPNSPRGWRTPRFSQL